MEGRRYSESFLFLWKQGLVRLCERGFYKYRAKLSVEGWDGIGERGRVRGREGRRDEGTKGGGAPHPNPLVRRAELGEGPTSN